MNVPSTTITAVGRAIRARIAVLVISLIGVAIVAFVIARFGTDQILTGPDGSIFVTDLNGSAALAELLAERSVEVTPGVTRLTTLDDFATVMIIDPSRSESFDQEEIDVLISFVEAGGRVVLAGRIPSELAERLLPPITPRYDARPSSTILVPTGGISGVIETAGTRAVVIDQPHLALAGDPPVAVAMGRGKGLIVYLSDGSVLHNRRIESNAAWAVSIIGTGPVLIDEVRHGFEQVPVIESPAGLLASLPPRAQKTLQALAVAGFVAMIVYGRRFTPIEQRVRLLNPPRRELVEAVAGLSLRTSDHRHAAAPVVSRVEFLTRRLAGISHDAPIDTDIIGSRIGVEHLDVALNPESDDDLVTSQQVLAELEQRSPI